MEAVAEDFPGGRAAGFVGDEAFAVVVEPMGKEEDVGVVGVEDIAGEQVVVAFEFDAELGEFAGGETAGKFPAAGNEAGAIDAHGVFADGIVQLGAFFRRVDVSGVEAFGDPLVELLDGGKSSPLVGDAAIHESGHPPAWKRAGGLVGGIGSVHADAVQVRAVEDVFLRRDPSVLQVSFCGGYAFMTRDDWKMEVARQGPQWRIAIFRDVIFRLARAGGVEGIMGLASDQGGERQCEGEEKGGTHEWKVHGINAVGGQFRNEISLP